MNTITKTLILLTCGASLSYAADLPNVLWITSEDNGPHLGCYGDAYATTPNLDALAEKGMIYTRAISNAPVCAPARTTIISGLYPPSTGSEHMRSMTRLPADFKMYPAYLRELGYYCTNNSKEDYNLMKEGEVWHESGRNGHWRNRPKGSPFFAIFNFTISHESKIRKRPHQQVHDPAKVRVPAYHPDHPEVRKDWAQYYDMITEMDKMVGDKLKELKDDVSNALMNGCDQKRVFDIVASSIMLCLPGCRVLIGQEKDGIVETFLYESFACVDSFIIHKECLIESVCLGRESKSHFFSNTLANLELSYFENSELEINIETTSNENYLKSHKIKSEITNNNSLLNSFLILRGSNQNTYFEAKMESYEDLTKEKSSDRYQYLLPSFEISKNFKNNLSLISNGYHKNYDTNIYEKVLINDLKYTSVPKINPNGLVNKFNLFFKNVTTEGDNSGEYSSDFRSQNFGSILYDISYPLKKEGNKYNNFLSGKASFMYSPNKNKNIKNLDRKINTKNIFNQNRLGLNDSVEGGQSLTFGGEYKITDKQNRSFLTAGLASVLRDKNEEKLPTSSTINNKSSDIIGSINFKPNNNFNLDYNFSVDNDLTSTNYNFIKADLTINKFVTSFEFLQEDDEIGTENHYSNEMKLILNDTSSLKYRTRRNKKSDLTEYYNLIYEYKNDCLTAAIQYNKDYYSDKDLKPNEEIFFSISILPFSSINSPSKRK